MRFNSPSLLALLALPLICAADVALRREPDAAAYGRGAEKGELKPGLKMHRIRAGEPDDRGWYFAKSTEGGFSVKVPEPFNDFTLKAKGGDAGDVMTYGIGTKTGKAVTFTAVAFVPPGGKFPNDPVVDMVAQFEKAGTLKKKSSVISGKLKGVEFTSGNERSSAVTRLFRDGGTLYTLLVEYPSSVPAKDVEPQIREFFDSFRPGIPGKAEKTKGLPRG